MDLAQLRSDARTITGYPERGNSGSTRLNNVITLAMRQLWREVPERYLSESFRIRAEPHFAMNTVSISSTDMRAWVISNSPTALTVSSLDPQVLRGRKLEVVRGDRYYYFTIMDAFWDSVPSFGQTSQWFIIVDRPWDNLTDTDLAYRIHTPEYPYPHWVKKVREVYYDPHGLRRRISPMPHRLMDMFRHASGFRQTGSPNYYARGSYHQVRSPHYTPTITVAADPPANQRWGYSSAGVETPAFGPAGTFSYRVVHVQGRRPFDDNMLVWYDTTPGGFPEQRRTRMPWYMSAPSPASAQQATTWGGTYIGVNTPDIDYVYGYGPDSSIPSYHRAGYEKWIFRARHATNTGGNPSISGVEADGIYYLWRIVDGDVTVTYDRGDSDPVNRNFPLEKVSGYHHIRFDRMPTEDRHIFLDVVRRPETLNFDTDIARIPPEFEQVMLDLVCSYLVGRRDGSPDRESAYFKSYLDHLDRLRQEESFAEHERMEFGDGIGPGDPAFGSLPREPIVEIP